MRRRRRTARQSVFMTACVSLIVAFTVLPLYWMVSSSFKNPTDIDTSFSWFPSHPTGQNYSYAFGTAHFLGNIENSLVVTFASTALVLILGTLAGYALARMPIRAKIPLLVALLMISVFPAIAVVAPLFTILRQLDWLNSYQALILPYTAFNLPFAVWILRNYFLGIPREMEEAGWIDGASPLRTLWQIILPQATPGLFTAGIFTFTACWTEYLMALSFDDQKQTIPVAIGNFSTIYATAFGPIFAASVVAAVPIAAVVLIFRKSVVSGLTSGAVKG